jgi:glutamate-1-semialdehyde 2,1-aminomutase
MHTITHSKELFQKAQNLIPGGVNSPVRAFKSVGGQPIFIAKAKGAYLYDVDQNQYIELINSWGPMILGHTHPIVEEAVARAIVDGFSFGAPGTREVDMAELICAMVPSIEKVRMVNSGTEATMAALRVARGYTQREKIIKFEGCYHGHADSFLISAGSGVLTLGIPDSPGVTKGVANDTLTAPYNDLQAVEQLISANPEQIAALILEPVVGNMGLVKPNPGFLEGLRSLCTKHGIVLIFDEVMTGFRLAKGGYQERCGVTPDLTTLGKIIGGGMPVGAYGGKKEIMDMVAPAGPVYQAGTLSGNPIAMAAGLAQLHYLNENPDVYLQIEATTNQLVDGLKVQNQKLGKNFTINHIGSMFTQFFTEGEVQNLDHAKRSNTTMFGTYFQKMLQKGIYLAPSQFESMFVSAAIEQKHVKAIVQAHAESLSEVLNNK